MAVARLAVAALFLVSPAFADVIDFENLPNTYMYLGGGQNIGTFYTVVDFEQNVTGLDQTGSTAYPAHSGSIVIWDPVDLSVSIAFASPESMVGIWYTSFDPLTLQAFDSASALLGSVVGAANTDGTTGSSNFLSFTGSDIASVTITGIPGDFVLDDLTFTSSTTGVPEPGSWAFLAVVFLCAAWKFRSPLPNGREIGLEGSLPGVRPLPLR